MEESVLEEPRSFPVVDVHLKDGTSKKSFRAGEDNDEAGGGLEELQESSLLQMSELGLPTSFTSSSRRYPYRSRGHRRNRFHDQVTPSLVSLNASVEEPPPFLVGSVQVSIGGAAVLNDQGNCSAVANMPVSSPASMDGEASALSCGVMVTTSAPLEMCKEVAGIFVSALGALLPNRESTVCERPKMSNVVMAESVEVISAEANVVEPVLLHGVSCAEGMFRSSKDDGTAERVGGLLTNSNIVALVVDAPSSTTDVGHEEIEGDERTITNRSSSLLVEARATAESASRPQKAMRIENVQVKGTEAQIAMEVDNVQLREIGPSKQETSRIDPKSACLGDLKWSPCWDSYYGRYYFYNAETLESTWEPPEGFETYAYICNAETLKLTLEPREGFETHACIESNKIPNSEDSLPKEIKVESLLEDSFVTDSLQQVVEIMSGLMDSKHEELCSAMECEEQVVLDSESPTCQEVSTATIEGSIVHVDPVDVLSKQEKMATQSLYCLSSQHLVSTKISPTVHKYWFQRFSLFSRYNSGIKLDKEGWYSVTPEKIAEHQAARCKGGVIVDAFAGVGGNAIQFALAGHYVVAIDNDRNRLDFAQNNAKVYGVANRIDFVLGDFFTVSSSMKADVVFLSPPWGGPDYLDAPVYDILTMLQPKDGVTLLNTARLVAPNIILFLPRNVDIDQLGDLSKMLSFSSSFEVERNFLNGKLKAVTAYYGQFEKMRSPAGNESAEL